jgi:toxin ParE1/3/4
VGRVTRTPRANADLDDIWWRVALDNPAAADRLIDRIVARCRDLAEYPRLGPACPEIAPEARVLVVGDYLTLYRVDGDNAEIVRVVHGARELKSLFGDEGDA